MWQSPMDSVLIVVSEELRFFIKTSILRWLIDWKENQSRFYYADYSMFKNICTVYIFYRKKGKPSINTSNIYDEMGLSFSMGEAMVLCVSTAETTPRRYLSIHTLRVALSFCKILSIVCKIKFRFSCTFKIECRGIVWHEQ